MKNQAPKAYIFDLESALQIKGKFREGVMDMFRAIKLKHPDTPIMIISKKTFVEVVPLILEIESNIGKRLNAKIASNSGNLVLDEHFSPVLRAPFDVQKLAQIYKVVHRVAPGSITTYRSVALNFRESAILARGISTKLKKSCSLVMLRFVNWLKAEKSPTFARSYESLFVLGADGGVLSLDIATRPNDRHKVATALKRALPDLAVSMDSTIHVGMQSKLAGVKKIFEDYGSDICYMGGNASDVKCFRYADKAVCLESKDQSAIKAVRDSYAQNGKFKVAINDLRDPELLNYVLGEDFDFDHLAQCAENCFAPLQGQRPSKLDLVQDLEK